MRAHSYHGTTLRGWAMDQRYMDKRDRENSKELLKHLGVLFAIAADH